MSISTPQNLRDARKSYNRIANHTYDYYMNDPHYTLSDKHLLPDILIKRRKILNNIKHEEKL